VKVLILALILTFLRYYDWQHAVGVVAVLGVGADPRR
jgi:hypothetical protein